MRGRVDIRDLSALFNRVDMLSLRIDDLSADSSEMKQILARIGRIEDELSKRKSPRTVTQPAGASVEQKTI